MVRKMYGIRAARGDGITLSAGGTEDHNRPREAPWRPNAPTFVRRRASPPAELPTAGCRRCRCRDQTTPTPLGLRRVRESVPTVRAPGALRPCPAQGPIRIEPVTVYTTGELRCVSGGESRRPRSPCATPPLRLRLSLFSRRFLGLLALTLLGVGAHGVVTVLTLASLCWAFSRGVRHRLVHLPRKGRSRPVFASTTMRSRSGAEVVGWTSACGPSWNRYAASLRGCTEWSSSADDAQPSVEMQNGWPAGSSKTLR